MKEWSIVILLTFFTSIVFHNTKLRLEISALLSAISTAILFQIKVYAKIGHIDPLAPVAVIIISFVSFVISCLLGLFIKNIKNRS